MLYPQANSFRQVNDLSGIWELVFDPGDAGESLGWQGGFYHGRPVAVPASWNDQFAEARDHLDPAWYQMRFSRPWSWPDCQIRLRFGSVNYHARVWLNGVYLGEHEGGHLPFEFEVGSSLRDEENLLVVRVDGRLGEHTVPPGNLAADETIGNILPFPSTSFDFFPYCGIHRPVLLYALPYSCIEDVTLSTHLDGGIGRIGIRLHAGGESLVRARLSLSGHGQQQSLETGEWRGETEVMLEVAEVIPWSPDAPNLYRLVIELLQDGEIFDRYSLPVGLRTVAVDGDALLLNGRPIELRGFGRHEDFPVVGRGYLPAVMVKDYELMRWVGANSFRTSHYPYSEAMLDLADRLGFLVIDETPAVGLFFKNDRALDRRLQLCRQQVREMIARDKNHPSVIAWSLANEPHSDHARAVPFFRELYDLAKSLDNSRPVTLARAMHDPDDYFEFLDLVCVNLYFGWYTHYGQLDLACQVLEAELERTHRRFGKPILLSEFGADTIPGHHAQPPEMFSEEYQAELIERYIKVARRLPYVIGCHVWNLCDFKTGQAVHRMGAINYKGVFTRDRRPKLAAHRLRSLWNRGG